MDNQQEFEKRQEFSEKLEGGFYEGLLEEYEQDFLSSYLAELFLEAKALEKHRKFLSSYLEEAAHAGACGKDPARYLATKAPTVLQQRIKALEGESEKRKVAIWLLLDHVDYTENNCRINEMVSATLPVEIIVKAKEALKEEDSE